MIQFLLRGANAFVPFEALAICSLSYLLPFVSGLSRAMAAFLFLILSYYFVPSFDGWDYEAYAFSLALTMGQRMPAPYRPYSFELRSSGHAFTRLHTAGFDRN
jgi:hypothetical protein